MQPPVWPPVAVISIPGCLMQGIKTRTDVVKPFQDAITIVEIRVLTDCFDNLIAILLLEQKGHHARALHTKLKRTRLRYIESKIKIDCEGGRWYAGGALPPHEYGTCCSLTMQGGIAFNVVIWSDFIPRMRDEPPGHDHTLNSGWGWLSGLLFLLAPICACCGMSIVGPIRHSFQKKPLSPRFPRSRSSY